MPQEFKASRSELKQLLRVFRRGLKALKPEDLMPRTPCPDSWTMASYVTGTLDQKAQRAINAHIAFCDTCFQDYVALVGPEKISETLSAEAVAPKEDAVQSWWRDLIEKLKKVVIDLSKTYGPGALVGSVRIVAEQPAFALRGETPAKAISKVLEISIDENTYSIELGLSENGSLACDIAGYKYPLRFPLSVSIRSEMGQELYSGESDDFGNIHIALPKNQVPCDLCLLILSLRGKEAYLAFRVPEGEESR